MKKYIKLCFISVLVVSFCLSLASSVYAVDVSEDAYKQFNKDMNDLYGIHSKKKEFDINDESSYGYQKNKILDDGKTYSLNMDLLKQGFEKFFIDDCLDGSYFVYSASANNNHRNRPSTLEYNNGAKKGHTEYQYLGYNLEGAKYDNPAYPWNSWDSSKPLKDWKFIKEPWTAPVIMNKYSIDRRGSTFSKEKIENLNKTADIVKSIEVGVFAKYIWFKAGDTVIDGGVSKADLDKSIYYGYKVTNKELAKVTGFVQPSEFKKQGGSWLDYVYILTPPTNKTWGSGYIFYENPNAINGVDYVTIPLAPFTILLPEFKIFSINDVTGCFLSEPKKVYNSTTKKYEMKTWVIRATREPITAKGSIPIQIWLKQGADDKYPFDNDQMGTRIFTADVEFTPEHPYWVKEITYPIPAKGQKSGIFVLDGGISTPAVNFVWRTNYDTLAYGSHSTSKESDFDDLPWDKIKAEYGITRDK